MHDYYSRARKSRGEQIIALIDVGAILVQPPRGGNPATQIVGVDRYFYEVNYRVMSQVFRHLRGIAHIGCYRIRKVHPAKGTQYLGGKYFVARAIPAEYIGIDSYDWLCHNA